MDKKCIFLLVLIFMFSQSLLLAQETINVAIGQQRTVPVSPGSQVNIGDPTIATARALPDQKNILITGIGKGVTSLTIISPTGVKHEKFIQVLQRDPKVVVKEINLAFGAIEGVEFKSIEGIITANGAVHSMADLEKLHLIIEHYPEIINLVTNLSEKRMVSVSINIIEVTKIDKTDFNNTPFPGVSVNAQNLPQTGKRFPVDALWNWEANITGLLDRIAYWLTTGEAKIVANPTIAVTDGDSAKFVSGGEIPFEYQTRDGLAIEWKEYGIIIQVKPQILGTGNILLRLDAELSNIDRTYQSAQTGIPAISSRKASNISVVNMGETVALAGIYQTYKTKNVKRVPILGHLLPFLFASVNEIKETKEIIVLVTPKAPAEISKSHYPMIEKEKRK